MPISKKKRQRNLISKLPKDKQKEAKEKIKKTKNTAKVALKSTKKEIGKLKHFLRVVGWALLTLILVYVPCWMAQLYENYIYNMGAGKLSRIQAAHYSNMITFGYNVAAISTVVIAYFMLKKLKQIWNERKHNK